MTKYAKCSVCGYAIAIPDDKNSNDYVCPNDGNSLTDATKSEYDANIHIKGHYSAIVYKDGSSIYAEDANGTTIAEGEAGEDDASVIQNAINQRGCVFIRRAGYTINDTINIKNGLSNVEIFGEGSLTSLVANMDKPLIEIGEVGTYSHNIKIADLALEGNNTSPIGIKMFRARLPIFEKLYIAHFTDSGIVIGGYSYYGQISGCHIYSNSNYGIYASYALYESGSLGPFSIRDVSLYNNTTDMYLHNLVAELATVSFESATNGIHMNNVKAVSLTSPYFEGLTYGIKVETSSVSRVTVIEPNFASDVDTILTKSGEGTAYIKWIGEWNHVSKSGTATIPSGNSSVVVDHGLVEAPDSVKLTGTHSEVANCWVTNKTDTQFTINAPANVTADRDVYWEAKV